MSIGIFELVNGVLTKKKIAGKTLMDAQLNANSRNGVQNRIITGEINDIKDDISTINTHLTALENNDIGTGYAISSTYTAPSDGYYTIISAGGSGLLYGHVKGANGVELASPTCMTVPPYERASLFVKKGMILGKADTDSTNNGTAYFYPLE